MTDLASWLLAQIADDEAAARAATPGPWKAQLLFDDDGEVDGPDGGTLVYNEGVVSFGTAAHIARHDPARVLAECAAKRAIVEWCSERERIYVGTVATDIPGPEDFVPGAVKRPADAVVLRLLAQLYADRPGWDPAWRIDP